MKHNKITTCLTFILLGNVKTAENMIKIQKHLNTHVIF